MGRLDDRVALVTGAARGLGAGIAEAFAREGAVVVCADVGDAGETVAGLAGERNHRAITLDVTDSSAVDDAVAAVVDEYGSLDILANNAGVAQPIGTFVETTDETIDKVLAVNVKGLIYCARASARVMIEQRRGRIINTASQAGKSAWPGWGIYSASKAAAIAVTQAMALELAPYDVTVNCVCPGTMLTNMTRTGFGEAAAAAGADVETMLADKAASIPARRFGTPEDMGLMFAWIASDESRFTTGASFNLTGGESVFF
jgi:NAD(P)-dependent dehydrogenase (short-subunit alcohol dehydrogenase family)